MKDLDNPTPEELKLREQIGLELQAHSYSTANLILADYTNHELIDGEIKFLDESVNTVIGMIFREDPNAKIHALNYLAMIHNGVFVVEGWERSLKQVLALGFILAQDKFVNNPTSITQESNILTIKFTESIEGVEESAKIKDQKTFLRYAIAVTSMLEKRGYFIDQFPETKQNRLRYTLEILGNGVQYYFRYEQLKMIFGGMEKGKKSNES